MILLKNDEIIGFWTWPPTNFSALKMFKLKMLFNFQKPFITLQPSQWRLTKSNLFCLEIITKLEIGSVERGICPIATLYSLAAACEGRGVGANTAQLSFTGPSCSQFCPKIGCHGNRGRQMRNLNDTIGLHGPENRRVGKTASNYFYGGQVIVNFVPKFVFMATGVGRREI